MYCSFFFTLYTHLYQNALMHVVRMVDAVHMICVSATETLWQMIALKDYVHSDLLMVK